MKSLVFFGRAYFFNSVFHQSTFSIVSSSLYKCFQQRSNPEKSVILIKLTVGFHLVCEHHQSRRLLNNEDINSRDSRETFCFVMIERHQVAEMTYCEFKDHKPKLNQTWLTWSLISSFYLKCKHFKPFSTFIWTSVCFRDEVRTFLLWCETFLISLRYVK